MVDRRVSGLPLEHVLGWARFHDLRIVVSRASSYPRRRHGVPRRPGRGSRAAPPPSWTCAAAPARWVPHWPPPSAAPNCTPRTSIRPPCAARAATSHLGGHVHQGDLFDALPDALRGRVDVLTANVPYVPTHEVGLLPPEARDHEPLVALDGGADGLDVLRRVTAEAPRWLAPGGCLLVETSERQAPAAVEAPQHDRHAGRLRRAVRERGGSGRHGRSDLRGGLGERPGPPIAMDGAVLSE